jgi:hypothetical protein
MKYLTEIIPKVLWQFERQRNMSWRADKPATLVYAEALDGGDPATKVDLEMKFFFGTHRLMPQQLHW